MQSLKVVNPKKQSKTKQNSEACISQAIKMALAFILHTSKSLQILLIRVSKAEEIHFPGVCFAPGKDIGVKHLSLKSGQENFLARLPRHSPVF